MEENNEKEIKINVPDGYVIDRKNSTFECIKFKKKESRFSDYKGDYYMSGVFIDIYSNICKLGVVDTSLNLNIQKNKNVFACRGAAVSALAFAQITQIRENECKRYGNKPYYKDTNVYTIFYNTFNDLQINSRRSTCSRLDTYLAFDTYEHAELFLRENTKLVKEYFMMD